jgi:lysozyme
METNLKPLLLVASAAILPPALLWYLDKKKMNQQLDSKPSIAEQSRKNLKAFLLMLQYSEGTYGANAYRTLYGGDLFNNYNAHPNKVIRKWGISSSAAGAYQFLYKTWIELAQALGLNDFSPISQDRAAVELIKRKGALEDVLAGRLATAIQKCRKIWASLPNAGYGQKEKSFNQLATVFQYLGGSNIG